jgi:cytochrome c oxidase subunit 2
MRAAVALLFVALVACVVWSFVVAPERGWWMPASASSTGDDVDSLFHAITALLAVAFVGTVGALGWLVWRGTRASGERARTVHGNAWLEGGWTIAIGAILTVLAFAQVSLWESMQSARNGSGRPFARVWASQFEWRFQYPGRDGTFDTPDDFETPYRLVVPAGERVRLELRSRDVIHGFFVPALRLKQDVLPGSGLLIAFEARAPGEHDLICAELCGSGHYRMAGRLQVVSREEFDAWNAEQQRAWSTNGKERP